MRYLSASVVAKEWGVSERSVRNYCAEQRISGAYLLGNAWKIPENAVKPERINKKKQEPITPMSLS